MNIICIYHVKENLILDIKAAKKVKKYSFIVFISYVIIYYFIILFSSEEIKGRASDICSVIGALLSLIIMGWSIRNFKEKTSRCIWTLCFFGNSSFLLGDFTWLYLEIIKNIKVPYPSIADLYYILTPIFYFMAFIIFFITRKTSLTVGSYLDILIMVIIATTIEWKFVFTKLFNNTSLSIFYKFASFLYPSTDLVLLLIAILMYFNYYLRNTNTFHSKLLIIAPLSWVIGDQIYIIKSNLGLYASGDIIDPLWIIGLLLVSLASIYNIEFNLSLAFYKNKLNIIENDTSKNYLKILLPYICAIILLIISSQYIQWDSLLIGSYTSIILIIIRQMFTLVDNKKLLYSLSMINIELLNSKLNLEKLNNQLMETNSLIEQEAITDFLTKLYNRRFVEKSLSDLIDKSNNEDLDLFLIILDIDHFKKVNDVYGHVVGDLVLKDLALLMENSIKLCDIVGRWGGEEFIILKHMPLNTQTDVIKQIAERIRINIESHEFLIDNNKFSITTSIGVTKWLKNHDNINSLVKRADAALYEAKNTGRNRVIIL